MEPNLVRKDIKYQKKTLAIVSVLVIFLFMGGSFALLSNSSETGEVVTFKTGNFNLEATTTGTLSLEGEAPKSYDDGFKNNDITLTLTNTGSLEIGKYDVKLEGDSSTTLESNCIRYSVSDDEGKTYLASKLLSETDNIIYTGYNLKDTKVLKVKLWIDEAAGEAALKKTYNGKINVELYQNEDTLVDVVKSKLVSNYSGSDETFEGGVVAVNNDGNLYHETNSETIREYRYNGQTVSNYVTFNDEIWRMLGLFSDENGEEHVKIVRNDVLNGIFPENYTINGTEYKIKGDVDNFGYWNMMLSGNHVANWSIAGLQYWLNTKSDDNNINKGYLSYLNKSSENMIAETKFYLGSVTNSSEYKILDTPQQAYINERVVNGCVNGIGPSTNNNQNAIENNINCRVWANNASTWVGKIALLYPSDIGFASNISFWNNQLGYSANNWIRISDQVNLLSPATNTGVSISQAISDKSLRGYGTSYAFAVLPTLYLKSNVKITSGEGTSTNPYSLILN